MALPKTDKIWMDGKLIPWDEAKIHVLSHALHYGTGVFEGIRCYDTVEGPAVFRLKEHIDRLFLSAGIYKLDIPFTPDQVCEAALETVRINKLKDCYIRPIAFYGLGDLGVMPSDSPVHLVLAVWPWGPYLGSEGLEQGVKLMITSWVRLHSSMFPASAKACGQYLNSCLSVMDARSKGFIESILLDKEGNVAEGSGENLFLVKDNVVITNDAESSILMGITRDAIIEIAGNLGYQVRIKTISKGELFMADEAFFTGTAAEVTPIREIDDRQIGSGSCPGPVTKAIQKEFFDVIAGRLPAYHKWLTFV
jgi:branched-chain amino acid aminotransferase